MYEYGIKNKYRPSQLAPKAYGWHKGATYEPADIPSQLFTTTGLSADVLRQQFAYEWFQSGDLTKFSGVDGLTNPPFVSGAAGRLHPSLVDSSGKPARILRGYIRRAEYDIKDNMSKCRLYFMYNPEIITREYVSYLEQSALDPFNTVYQSGNLIAPPSILNFSFELFFDRQEEAMQADHPGVFVDYQFFDMVVRNVLPQDSGQTNNVLPDNGVMMVNPRDITVVFSPQLTVQGRPTNAQVVFEKFTHRMVPTRMRIQLQILASYFGPVKDMVEYKAEELPHELAVPIDDFKRTVYDITYDEVESSSEGSWFNDVGMALGNPMGALGELIRAGLGGGGGVLFKDVDLVKYGQQILQNNDGNAAIRLQAMNWAYDNYSLGGPGAQLVTHAYDAIGQASTMGWKTNPGTAVMMARARANKEVAYLVPLSDIEWDKDLLPGDLLIKDGHVAYFKEYKGTSGCVIFDAPGTGFDPQISEHNIIAYGSFTHLLRPTPMGSTGSAAQATAYNGPSRAPFGTTDQGVLTFEQTVEAVTGLGKNIRLSPSALPAWNAWRAAWAGPIPCSSGWRNPIDQQREYLKDPKRFAPAASSYHCKGLAVDVDMNWLGPMSASEQTRFRNAAAANGWGQARWRKSTGPAPGYEAPCNWQNGTKTDEPWHFSWGGCG